MELSGKIILVTGATAGIGEEFVKMLHSNNQVIALGRSQEKLQDLQGKFKGIAVIKADLATISGIESAAEQILQQFGRLDVLINNAAVQYTAAFNSSLFKEKTIIEEVHANFLAPCILVARLLPLLSSRGERSVVFNVNSGLAITPKTSSAVYCATKAALDSFSVSLGYQLEKTGIRVLQAFLPLVDTDMTQGRGDGKLTANEAVRLMLRGIEKEKTRNYIGKTKLLYWIHRIFPGLAASIMKNS